MTFTRKEWSCVIGIAIGLHFALVVGYAHATLFGAHGEGIGGVEIGLGQLNEGSDLMDSFESEPTEIVPTQVEPTAATHLPPHPPSNPHLYEIDVSNDLVSELPMAPDIEAIDPYADFDSSAWLTLESNYSQDSATGKGTSKRFGGNPGYRVRYADLVRAKLNRFKRYPAAARHQAIEGTATLFLHLNKDGSILDAYVEKSSGNELLDSEVLRMVDRASPLPSFQKTETRDTWKLLIPIVFNLTNDS